MLFDRPMPEIVIEEGWRDKLAALAGLRRDSWPLLALIGGFVVIALVLTGRDAPAQIAPPAEVAVADAAAERVPAATPAASILVHVAGAVRRPGLYEFPAGTRVADAIESAGGPTARADLDLLNLAEPLVDGTKVEVLERGETTTIAAATPSGGATASPAAGTISLNMADQALLETIPGVGPVTAAAILQHRQEIGRFESLEQLLDVDGIGPATFDGIRSYLTL